LIGSLSIENFRGIKKGKVDGFGRINIFVGKNNSGKSTILELLCFIKAPLKPKDVLNEFVLSSLLQRRVKRELPAEVEFFHEYLPENHVNIEAKFVDGFPLHFAAIYEDSGIRYYLLFTDSSGEKDILARFFMTARGDPIVEIFGEDMGTFHQPLQFLLEHARKVLKDNDIRFPWIASRAAENYLRFISDIVLVDADFVRKIEHIEDTFWADIIKRRTDKQLRSVLNQIYGLQIESFSFANYRQGKSKIFAMLPKISMHIDDYGDGFRYAFSILTIASQIKNTALLLEEPEVHQHEGALKPLFKALDKLSSNNNLQVFISTHSLDVIKTWTQLTGDAKIFHFKLGVDGKLEVRVISGADAKLMMDLGVSPLRLDESHSYLVLEGKEDKAFFETIAKKLKEKSLKDLGYEVLLSPKSEQRTAISALAFTGKPIISCIDFDKKNNLTDLIQPFVNSLKNKYKEVEIKDNKVKVKETGTLITFVPMGLPHDEDISQIGISKYAMEDFIVKLLCIDKNLQKWAEIDLKELRKRAQSFKDKASLNSSKTLLMTLGVIKGGKTLEILIPEIIKETDSKLLTDTLEPIIGSLFA